MLLYFLGIPNKEVSGNYKETSKNMQATQCHSTIS